MASVLLAAAVLALGVPLLLYLVQERLIFFPRPTTEAEHARIAASTPQAQSIFVRAPDGTALHAWYVAAGESAPLVIYFGGNAEEVSWMIAQVRARAPRAAWLLTDYRGYGASAGAPSERAFAADALAWFDHATASWQPPRIYAFGRSIGSAVAVSLAAERPVAGVIAVAPFDSLTEVAKRHYPFLPIGRLLRHPFDAVSVAPRVSAPLLCLVAGADEIIPAARSRALYEAWGGPKTWVVLEDAGHNSTDGSPLFWESIRTFLAGADASP